MQLLSRRYRYKEKHTITLVAEFIKDKQSLSTIARLSEYISNISSTADILTDLQSFSAGYRITFVIKYQRKWYQKKNHYTTYLSNLSDWLYNDKDTYVCLSKYHYNHV